MVKTKILAKGIHIVTLAILLQASLAFAQTPEPPTTAPPPDSTSTETAQPQIPTLYGDPATNQPDATTTEITATETAQPTTLDPIEIEVGGPPTAEDIKKTFQNEGFTIVPTHPNNINERNFIFELRPGETVKDSVTIANLAGTEVTFLLYGADPTFSVQGTPAYKTRQSNANAEGGWITFNQPEITLKAGEEKIVEFTLQVPKETDLGEYRAGIAMEKSKQDTNNPGITIATRILLHTDITVTQNPKPIPKKGEAQVQPPAQQSTWQIYYFWISLILFIASFAALIWVTFRERHQKEKAKEEEEKKKEKPAAKPTKPTPKSAKKSTKTPPKKAAKKTGKKKK